MSTESIIALVGLIVGILQGIIIIYLSSLKKDIADIWQRMNNHYHEVSCANDECRTLKTGNVIIMGTK